MENLKGVEDTLFIPLAARVMISRKFPNYFYDEKALELENLEEIKRIMEKSSEYTAMASVARYYNMDHYAKDFIERHKGGNVINLGAGLESINYRIKDDRVTFYSIDYPKVIETREIILGIGKNEKLISCDIKDMSWTEEVNLEKPSMLIVSGVFQYFHKEEVLEFIKNVKEKFKDGEMVFDATNKFGIKYAQKYVKKTGNKSAMMYFYINNPEKFAKEAGVKLLESRGFFDEVGREIGKKTRLYTRIAMSVADKKHRTMILHIKL